MFGWQRNQNWNWTIWYLYRMFHLTLQDQNSNEQLIHQPLKSLVLKQLTDWIMNADDLGS